MAYSTRKKETKSQQRQKMAKSQAPKLKAKKGKPRFVFFLGDDGGILVMMQGRMVVRRLFAHEPSEESMAPLIDLLEDHPAAPLSVLVDMMDQSYVRHTLPPVSPLSVNKLVQRRLARDFGPDDITGAISLGREKVGRKDWNFLLIALTNNPTLQEWLKLLMEMPNKFEGVFLAPVECQQYIKALDGTVKRPKDTPAAQWQLLVSHHKVGGFRQVVLKDGKMVFTRLAQSVGAELPEVVAGNIEQEILNTIEYLRRLSYNEKAGLDIFLVVSAEIKDLIDATKFNALMVNRFTPSMVSDELKLPQAALSGDRFGDVVIAAAFGVSKKREMKLLPKYAQKLSAIMAANTALRGVAAIAVLGLLAYAGMSYMDKGDAEQQMRSLENRQVEVDQKLEETRARVADLGDDELLRNAIAAVVQEYEPYRHRPLSFLERLKPVVEERALLRELQWSLVSAAAGGGQNGFSGGGQQGQAGDLPLEVVLSFETSEHEGQVEVFSRIASLLMARLKEAFPDFNMERTKLVGEVEEDESISITLEDELANQELSEEEDNVNVTLTGPIPGADTEAGGFGAGAQTNP